MKLKRKAKILAALKRDGCGLEIGPSYNPVAPKREGFNVETIDHLSQQQLREKYRGEDVDTDAIEPVDYVWSGETYRQLVGPEKHYDWVIASHVIEHVPDLVRFINACAEVLKPDGILSLVVPDARYCFDQFRPITGLASVVDTHLAGVTKHSAGSVLECVLNASSKNGKHAWSEDHRGNSRFLNPEEVAHDLFRNVQTQAHTDYIDIHRWCFTPSSFRLILSDLKSLGLIDMVEVSFFDTKGCEFFVALSREGSDHQVPDRLGLLDAIQYEAAAPYLNRNPITSKLYRMGKKGLATET